MTMVPSPPTHAAILPGMTSDREFVLQPLRGTSGASSYAIGTCETVIGSSTECEICLPGAGIAPRHAVICWHNGLMRISALDHRLWLNDGPVRNNILRVGDRLTIGPLQMVVAERIKAPESSWLGEPILPNLNLSGVASDLVPHVQNEQSIAPLQTEILKRTQEDLEKTTHELNTLKKLIENDAPLREVTPQIQITTPAVDLEQTPEWCELQARQTELESRMVEAARKLAQAERSLLETQLDRDGLEKLLDVEKLKSEDQLAQLHELNAQVQLLEKTSIELQSATTELDRLHAELEGLKSTHQDRENQTIDEQTTLASETAIADHQVEELTSRLDDYAQKLAKAEQALWQTQIDRDHISKQLDVERLQTEDLQQALASFSSQIEDLQSAQIASQSLIDEQADAHHAANTANQELGQFLEEKVQLETEIARLSRELEQTSELLTELKSRETSSALLEQENQNLAEKLAESEALLTDQTTMFVEQMSEYEAQSASLQQALLEIEERAAQLQSQIIEETSSAGQLEEALAHQQEELSRQREEFNEHLSALRIRSAHLDNLEQEINQAHRVIDEKHLDNDDEKKSLECERMLLADETAECQQQLLDIQKERRALESERNQLALREVDLGVADDELTEKYRELSLLQSTLQSDRVALQEMKLQLDAQKLDCEHRVLELEKSKDDLLTREEQVKAEQTQLARMKDERTVAQQRFQEEQTRISDLKNEKIATLEAEQSRLHHQISQYEEKIQALEETALKAQTNYDVEVSRTGAAQEALKAFRVQQEELHAQLHDELDALKSQLNFQQDREQELLLQLTQKETELSALDEQLSDARRDAAQFGILGLELTEFQVEKSSYVSRIEDLETQLETTRNKFANLGHQSGELADRLTREYEELEEARSQFLHRQAELDLQAEKLDLRNGELNLREEKLSEEETQWMHQQKQLSDEIQEKLVELKALEETYEHELAQLHEEQELLSRQREVIDSEWQQLGQDRMESDQQRPALIQSESKDEGEAVWSNLNHLLKNGNQSTEKSSPSTQSQTTAARAEATSPVHPSQEGKDKNVRSMLAEMFGLNENESVALRSDDDEESSADIANPFADMLLEKTSTSSELETEVAEENVPADEEVSIQDYMSKLLQRTQKWQDPQGEKAKNKASISSGRQPQSAASPATYSAASKSYVSPSNPGAISTSDSEVIPEPAPFKERPAIDKHATREDIKRLRELANNSARVAVATHTWKQTRIRIWVNAVLAGISTVLFIGFLSTPLWAERWYAGVGILSGGIAALTGYELRRLLKNNQSPAQLGRKHKHSTEEAASSDAQ